MGSSCCTTILRETPSNEEVVIQSENIRKSSQKKNSKSSTNSQKSAQNKTDIVDVQQFSFPQILDASIKSEDENQVADTKLLQESKEQNYTERQLEEDEKTPGFANISMNHENLEFQEKDLPIVFLGETNEPIDSHKKPELLKKNKQQLGNSPVKIFVSRNSLKRLATDQEKLNKLRSLSVEEQKETTFLKIKRSEKQKLSRSFSQFEEEKKSTNENDELQSCNSINMKKSILKKNLKYSAFKKTKTLKEGNCDANDCDSINSRKKVTFDQTVLKKQQSKSKFY